MVNPALIVFLVLAAAALAVFVVARRTVARAQVPAGCDRFAISILPVSSLGWWSVGLAVAFVLAIAATVLAGDDLLDAKSNQALALSLKVFLIAVSAASLAAGLVAFLKRRDASVLVLAGMLVTLWLGLITGVAHLFME